MFAGGQTAEVWVGQLGLLGVFEGTLFWCILTVLLVVTIFVLLCVHLAHRRAMRARLRQAQHLESLGRLAGGIAHDFNNLLSGMLGAAELALDHVANQPELRERLELIRNISLRAADLTRALQTFARRDAHLLRPMDLHALLKDILAFFSRSIDRRISVHNQFAAASSTILADVNLIQNAFLNLLINARDAMPEGGTLTVSTRNRVISRNEYVQAMPALREGHYLEVAVSDTGTGIAPENMENLFVPFFSTKPLDQGSGLGLSAVYGAVCQHHGAIECTSAPGSGTRFTLYFPVARLPRTESSDAPAVSRGPDVSGAGPEARSLRILVLDDEATIREVITQTLRVLGHRPLVAATSDEALTQFRESQPKPDLVILDLILPHGSGADVARKIWEQEPATPVIFASGLSQQDMDSAQYARHTFVFLHKPFGRRDLESAIHRALSQDRPPADRP